MTNRRTLRLFGYRPVLALRRSGAFLFYSVIRLTIGYIGLQCLARIAQIHFKVDYVVMDDDLFNQGMYEAFLCVYGGFVEVLHGKLQGSVQVVGRICGEVVGGFLRPELGEFVFHSHDRVVQFGHLYFIGRTLRYCAAHGQVEQSLGFMVTVV